MDITTESRLAFDAETALWETVGNILAKRRARLAPGPRLWVDLTMEVDGRRLLPCTASQLSRRYTERRRSMCGAGLPVEGADVLSVESLAAALSVPDQLLTVADLLALAGISDSR